MTKRRVIFGYVLAVIVMVAMVAFSNAINKRLVFNVEVYRPQVEEIL